MESMRSLNKSLPSSQPNRQGPPEQLLQLFRGAALSVTTLYKSAVADQANSRRAGYQDALEDLLKFLDQENLGVQDGEGWRIREWATQRYDGGSYQHQSDTDDERSEPETRPVPISSNIADNSEHTTISEHQADSTGGDEPEDEVQRSEQPPMFRFTGSTPSEQAMQTDDSDSNLSEMVGGSSSSPAAPIRVEVLNRSSKASSKPPNSRHNSRSTSKDFTFTSGTKRKLHFPEFFDISDIQDRRDGSSGGSESKRGRFV